MSEIYCIVPVFHETEFKKFFASCPDYIRLVVLDNTKENRGIPIRYNEFIDSLPEDEDAWCIFCHDDLEFLDWSFARKLASYPRDVIVGPLGAMDDHTHKRLIQKEDVENRAPDMLRVDTLDCMCMICHSSIFGRGLRFDEKLSWHLYVEDFCISAKLKFNLNTCVVPISCNHYSDGQVNEEYLRHQHYLSHKYRGSQYWGTCGMIGDRIGPKRTLLQAINRIIWEKWVVISRS